MRIFLTHRPPAAYGFISEGWLNALTAAGYDARRWDGQRQSWDEFGPQLVIGCSGHRQPIPPRSIRRSSTKVAIHVNPYGPTNTGVNEAADAIAWTLDQQPDAVFGYGHEGDRYYWEHWYGKEGVPWVPMPTAGDAVAYGMPAAGAARDVHVAYVGGHWPYKGKNIDRYLIPALRDAAAAAGAKYQVFGWGGWPAGVSGGDIGDGDVVALLGRALVAPCISEPHTVEYGFDLPERLWKAALCGALVVHDPARGLDRHMPSAVVGGNPAHYSAMVRHFASPSGSAERGTIAGRQRREALRNTYFHRLAGLFAAVGLDNSALLARATACEAMADKA